MRVNDNTPSLGNTTKLLAILGATFGAEIALHAYLGSHLPGADWLFSVYNYQFVPSGKTQVPLFDLVVPCAIALTAVGVLAYRWHIAAFVATALAVASASMAVLPVYYGLLNRAALWWLPISIQGLLHFYLLASMIPAFFVLGAFVLRAALRSRDATLRVVEGIHERLSDPLLPSDLQHGWTDTKKAQAICLIAELRAAAIDRFGELRPEHSRRVQRWLADADISGGCLAGVLERVATGTRGQLPWSRRCKSVDVVNRDVAAVTERLSDPLLPSDIRHGWTQLQKDQITAFFISLNTKLKDGHLPDNSDLNNARYLMDNIPKTGQLAGDLAYINETLRKYVVS